LEDADDDVERNAMTDSNPGLRELKGLNIVLSDLRSQWEDPNSPDHYPINVADKDNQGIGPLLGRYPGDIYDGDVAHPSAEDHPWALCTCNFAQLYYTLAN
jgi:hypothetical protein